MLPGNIRNYCTIAFFCNFEIKDIVVINLVAQLEKVIYEVLIRRIII